MSLVYPNDWELVPRNLKEKVCGPGNCTEGNGERILQDYEDQLGGDRYKRPPRHRTCGKPLFTYIYRCNSCHVIFIKDFGYTNWCLCNTYCWDCMSELRPARCTYHSNSDRNSIWEPVGLNPKKYSDDDINATLEELGLDIVL